MIILIVILISLSTPQVHASEFSYGAATFKSNKDPLAQLIKDVAPGKRRFDSDSSNWAGYTAKYDIVDGILYLDEFVATRGGKRVAISTVLGDDWKHLPKEINWSGELVFPIGSRDENGVNPFTLRFVIDNGKVVGKPEMEISKAYKW